jgi:hypothetical protein
MSTIGPPSYLPPLAVLCITVTALVGCGTEEAPPRPAGPPKKAEVDSNVTLEEQGDRRRVLINAWVCKRESEYIEFLLSRTGLPEKDHESILQANVHARAIHQALVQAGARPGSPVQYEPEFRPPRGTVIKISLRYEQDGKQHTVPAQSWLRTKSGKPVAFDWVFVGSVLADDPFDIRKPKQYMAQVENTIITLGNVPTALLDINIRGTRHYTETDFTYYTERIPPEKTKVTVILEPAAAPQPGH